MFSDLALNILAEVIGIVVTVFWLDRLIARRDKEREENRWLPSKHYLYYHFSYSISTLLEIVLVDGSYSPKVVYFFGKKQVKAQEDFLEITSKSADYHVSRFIKSYDDKKNEVLMSRGENTERFIDVYGQLLEPELLYLLIEYRDLLRSIGLDYQGGKKYRSEWKPMDDSAFKGRLIELVNSMYPILIWLDKHATKKMGIEEYDEMYLKANS